jgi:hypothetical protein
MCLLTIFILSSISFSVFSEEPRKKYLNPLFSSFALREKPRKKIGSRKGGKWGQLFILYAFIFFSIFLSFLILSLRRLHAWDTRIPQARNKRRYLLAAGSKYSRHFSLSRLLLNISFRSLPREVT